jgi:hypothetical protein
MITRTALYAAVLTTMLGWRATAQDKATEGKASGRIAWKRQHAFKVVTCVAVWTPAYTPKGSKEKEGARLDIRLFSFPLEKDDLAKAAAGQTTSLAESKPNPDPALWKYAPCATLQIVFEPDATQFTLEKIRQFGLSISGAQSGGIGISRDPVNIAKELKTFTFAAAKSVKLTSKVASGDKEDPTGWELDVDAPVNDPR